MIVSKVRLVAAAAAVCALTACGSGGEVTATQPVPAPITTAPATPDPSTPDPATPDPATPDPATPDPATPDPGTPDPAAEPVSTQVDAASFRPGPDTGTAGGGVYFRSPSGNVNCGILDPDVAFAGCQALSSVPSSEGTVCKNFGNSLYMNTIGPDGAVSACTSQGVFFTSPPSKVLEYGQVISARGVTCESTTSGIECTQGSSGFVMSRDQNVIR